MTRKKGGKNKTTTLHARSFQCALCGFALLKQMAERSGDGGGGHRGGGIERECINLETGLKIQQSR